MDRRELLTNTAVGLAALPFTMLKGPSPTATAPVERKKPMFEDGMHEFIFHVELPPQTEPTCKLAGRHRELQGSIFWNEKEHSVIDLADALLQETNWEIRNKLVPRFTHWRQGENLISFDMIKNYTAGTHSIRLVDRYENSISLYFVGIYQYIGLYLFASDFASISLQHKYTPTDRELNLISKWHKKTDVPCTFFRHSERGIQIANFSNKALQQIPD